MDTQEGNLRVDDKAWRFCASLEKCPSSAQLRERIHYLETMNEPPVGVELAGVADALEAAAVRILAAEKAEFEGVVAQLRTKAGVPATPSPTAERVVSVPFVQIDRAEDKPPIQDDSAEPLPGTPPPAYDFSGSNAYEDHSPDPRFQREQEEWQRDAAQISARELTGGEL